MQTKQCTICKEIKLLSEYNKKSSSKDGLQNHCKECNRKKSREYYHNNREKHKNITGLRRDKKLLENQIYVFNYLQSHPCVDCGESNPIVLEFDHLYDKQTSICVAVRNGWSLKRLKKEIAKCEVRCANCHRLTTAKDFNWFTYKFTTDKN